MTHEFSVEIKLGRKGLPDASYEEARKCLSDWQAARLDSHGYDLTAEGLTSLKYQFLAKRPEMAVMVFQGSTEIDNPGKLADFGRGLVSLVDFLKKRLGLHYLAMVHLGDDKYAQ